MDEFKLIVAGGRDFADYKVLSHHINLIAETTDNVSIVSGMARGADALAVRFAKEYNVKLYEFHADWNAFDMSAGYVRNKEMAEFADGLLAFWDGKSKGTKHMIDCMTRLNKPVKVVEY